MLQWPPILAKVQPHQRVQVTKRGSGTFSHDGWIEDISGTSNCTKTLLLMSIMACSLRQSRELKTQCMVEDAITGRLINLRPLAKRGPLNASNYQVSLCAPPQGGLCGNPNATVCLNGKPMALSNSTYVEKRYQEIILTYTGSESLGTKAKKYEIELICPTQSNYSHHLMLKREHEELTVFSLYTPLACSPMAPSCTFTDSDNLRYNLAPLGVARNTTLDIKDKKNALNYTTLEFTLCGLLEGNRCDGPSSACLLPPPNSNQTKGFNLGYPLNIPTKSKAQYELLIEMVYTGGDPCPSNTTHTASAKIFLLCSGTQSDSKKLTLIGVTKNCQYTFLMSTIHACPLKQDDNEGGDCTVIDHRNDKLFDLRSLRKSQEEAGYPVEEMPGLVVNVCGPLKGDKAGNCYGAGACVNTTNLGMASQNLKLVSGELKLTYKDGSTCSRGMKRRTEIEFVCLDQKYSLKENTIRVLNLDEHSCTTNLIWYTSLACINTQTSCLAGTYDLSLLTQKPNEKPYEMDIGGGNLMIINVCHSLDHPDKRCQGSGSCIILPDNSTVSAGRPSSLFLEDDRPVLLYTSGSPCPSNALKTISTRIEFSCSSYSMSEGWGLPEYNWMEDCEHVITWETPLACPIEEPTVTEDCKIASKVNKGYYFDLHPLSSSTKKLTTKSNREFYLNICDDKVASYTPCGAKVGACEWNNGTYISTGLINSRLVYRGEYITLMYIDGQSCNNNTDKITTIIEFVCATNESISYLEDMENECTRVFLVKTPLACYKQVEEDAEKNELEEAVKRNKNTVGTSNASTISKRADILINSSPEKMNDQDSKFEVWNDSQYIQFKEKYPWLSISKGRLGCNICASVKTLGAAKSERIHISPEWSNYLIEAAGKDRASKLSNIRMKIKKHLENENIKLFRTAYNIAKTNRPYSDYENHITLQTLNGIKLGSTLHSRYSATQIINHIACEMRKMLVTKILSTNSKITILIDESTTLSNKSTLVILLKAYLGGESIDYIFLDLCELQCQDSENIEKELLNILYKHGLNEEYLKENWIAIATDGQSPKNCRALEEACHELGTRFAKVGRILGVRWISSSFRTIKTVWESYESLHHHFKSSTYLDSTYQGLLRRLESPEFILDLGLMYDTLQEMSMLSLELQSRTTTLQKAEHIIKKTIRVIESFKTSPGEKSLLALEAAENLPQCNLVHEGHYYSFEKEGSKGYTIVDDPNDPAIQYYISLCRPLDVPNCPKGSGVCMMNNTVGTNMGRPNGDLIVSFTKELTLIYDQGDPCLDEHGSRYRTVITFACDPADNQKPVVFKHSACIMEFMWYSSSACPHKDMDANSYMASSCVFSSDADSPTYSVSDLKPPSPTSPYEVALHDGRKLLVSLCVPMALKEQNNPCRGSTMCLVKNTTYTSLGKHLNLKWLGGGKLLTLKYENGSDCVMGENGKGSSYIQFACDPTAGLGQPQARAVTQCHARVYWPTSKVCQQDPILGCMFTLNGRQYDLFPLSSYSASRKVVDPATNNTYQINICRKVNGDFKGCDKNAAVCMKPGGNDNNYQTLALPNLQSVSLNAAGELVMSYYGGSPCNDTYHSVQITFKCGKEFGSPKLLSVLNCVHMFEWTSYHACDEDETKIEEKWGTLFDRRILKAMDVSALLNSSFVVSTGDRHYRDQYLFYINLASGGQAFKELEGNQICANSGVCQAKNNSHFYRDVGSYSTRSFYLLSKPYLQDLNLSAHLSSSFLDNSSVILTLTSRGRICGKTKLKNVTSVIHLSCSEKDGLGAPEFSYESGHCNYIFDWETDLVCPRNIRDMTVEEWEEFVKNGPNVKPPTPPSPSPQIAGNHQISLIVGLCVLIIVALPILYILSSPERRIHASMRFKNIFTKVRMPKLLYRKVDGQTYLISPVDNSNLYDSDEGDSFST
ncbi:hypothetical protein LAZ67_17002309 [Cordylochernes scorpioides]|uniref:MRH domain-containing protein n=1 Tax=Cordylochernes scorpioides TaxID=51811 RepID=A0ABY6LDW4_9ARAC|nr:hypothetical protein LAZ67_17002309 [Cordylochernes scorpioides]